MPRLLAARLDVSDQGIVLPDGDEILPARQRRCLAPQAEGVLCLDVDVVAALFPQVLLLSDACVIMRTMLTRAGRFTWVWALPLAPRRYSLLSWCIWLFPDAPSGNKTGRLIRTVLSLNSGSLLGGRSVK